MDEKQAESAQTVAPAISTREFTAAEIGALAHLYRGEVYRSTVWRTRLDNTTNWAVVTTGLAFSITFAGKDASPLPLILVGFLICVFLLFEAHRYRYFNVWRARARHMEREFYVPMLRGEGAHLNKWNHILADDYCKPHHHISLPRAIGRRLRRNYAWVLSVQAIAYYGKLAIHPSPLQSLHDLYARAVVGPIPGEVVIACGILFHGSWMIFAYVTWRKDVADRKRRSSKVAMG
ncbi:DUF2270 domain-containing protein [uncultured Thiothrix sp.]|uniref:DUF2270 domain-containing protein n=1 Tax=uncultured Thiothrix sp. TaxID=223185 RepID=UPI00262484E8|nr:DUF2270 domain-containing protein [uncultured Thiothrix sp.]